MPHGPRMGQRLIGAPWDMGSPFSTRAFFHHACLSQEQLQGEDAQRQLAALYTNIPLYAPSQEQLRGEDARRQLVALEAKRRNRERESAWPERIAMEHRAGSFSNVDRLEETRRCVCG